MPTKTASSPKACPPPRRLTSLKVPECVSSANACLHCVRCVLWLASCDQSQKRTSCVWRRSSRATWASWSRPRATTTASLAMPPPLQRNSFQVHGEKKMAVIFLMLKMKY
jgi:hypothetical protein